MRDKYTVGEFSAENVAVGHGASARSHSRVTPAVEDAIEKLGYFVSLIPEHIELAHDSASVCRQAAELEAALRKKKLDRGRIEKILGTLTVAVSGTAALANAISAIQSAVTRLFS
jgi:hypothetical protein